MQPDSISRGRIRFGDFEIDLESRELRRSGRKLRLQGKSFLVLHQLLRSAGRVVTREELAAALWPSERFVDTEHGVNTAVRRLREVLGDSAGEPRFIETLPKVGYRFIGTIEAPAEPVEPADPAAPAMAKARGATRWPRRAVVAAAVSVAVLVAIAAVLGPRLASGRGARSETLAPDELDTVGELLARARYLRNHKRLAESHRFVEEALKLDPSNAEALAGRALGLLSMRRYEQARETALRAIELDPDAWEAHRALGNLAAWSSDYAGAEHHLRRAVEANPADSKSRNRLARHLLDCGRLDEALEQMLASRRLAPDDPDVQNIWVHHALLAGNYESAIRHGEIWMAVWEGAIDPGVVSRVRYALGLAYVGARRHEDAMAQFRAIDPDDDLLSAVALGHAGRTREARAIVDAHRASDAAAGSPPDPGVAEATGMACVALGDLDGAFEHLDRQLAAHVFPAWVHLPLFEAIRRDARWPAFAERLEQEFFSGARRPLPAPSAGGLPTLGQTPPERGRRIDGGAAAATGRP